MIKQEVKPCEFVSGACIHCQATEQSNCEGWVCPPQRPWVGLTDDDWDKVWDMPDTFDQGAAWAAARLKERNK